MKKLTLLVLSLFFCAGALGFDLPGGQFGLPLEKGEYDLVWDAPTNELPSALWVYRVLPAQFSPMVISNLMALGSFTLRDRKPPRNPAWNHPPPKRIILLRRFWEKDIGHLPAPWLHRI